MKGLILAAGTGSRLHPLTVGVSKHLLPVHNKPMIFYPLTTLILAGVREICIVVNPSDEESYRRLLGNGSRYGVELEIVRQKSSLGLPDAIASARLFSNREPLAVILGDNVIFGSGFGESLSRIQDFETGAVCFAQSVRNPHRFGVISMQGEQIVDLAEKPERPKSNLALVGFYLFDGSVQDRIRELSVSKRGEKEIVDLLCHYLRSRELEVEILPRSVNWLDAGTIESLGHASEFVRAVENRTGLLVGSPEEAAVKTGRKAPDAFLSESKSLPNSDYLMKLVESLSELQN